MKFILKGVKTFALICLIALAVFGIGISGAAPTSSTNRLENKAETKIELLESKEEESELSEKENDSKY